jgi:hypothetical protein
LIVSRNRFIGLFVVHQMHTGEGTHRIEYTTLDLFCKSITSSQRTQVTIGNSKQMVDTHIGQWNDFSDLLEIGDEPVDKTNILSTRTGTSRPNHRFSQTLLSTTRHLPCWHEGGSCARLGSLLGKKETSNGLGDAGEDDESEG